MILGVSCPLATWSAIDRASELMVGNVSLFHIDTDDHVAKIGYRVVVNKEYGLVWGPDSMVPRLKDIQDFFGNLVESWESTWPRPLVAESPR